MAKKPKKEKVTYIDDGRTIADMSGISRKGYTDPSSHRHGKPSRFHSPLREQLRTFFDAMGFMLLPTLVMVGLLIAAFLIVYLIL